MSHLGQMNWWKNSTCYQVWPASYKDSNGDGIGDIPGILETIDYLKDLGIDVVWLSPMYDSPQVDMGYDISDYENIYPKFGTMADMDTLIHELHKRDMKIIIDLVINHTSDEHAWFQESKKSKDNPYSDWYMWRDPKHVDGKRKPPNNWRSIFGGSAWEYVPERDQYYLHLFTKEQPDLNWENPVTRRAIYKSAIEFWLDRGVDGFRIDAANLYSKNVEYPDAPITDPGVDHQVWHFHNGPRMHEWMQEMRKESIDKYGDVMVVGELPATDVEDVLRYVSADRKEMGLVFDFDMVNLGDNGTPLKHLVYRHKLTQFKEAVIKTQKLVMGTDAWTTIYAENHDQARSISRFANDDPKYRVKAGKLLAIHLASLTGTLFLYQGQEIGMVNYPESWGPEELRDAAGLNYYNEWKQRYPDDKSLHHKILMGLQKTGRDNARTPVHWDGSANAGFTTGTPWIRVQDNYTEINVADQQRDPASVLATWKHALRLRKEHADVFIHGDFEVHDFENENVFSYVKVNKGKTVFAALNFSDSDQPMTLPEALQGKKMDLLIANVDNAEGETLSPWEARLYLAA